LKNDRDPLGTVIELVQNFLLLRDFWLVFYRWTLHKKKWFFRHTPSYVIVLLFRHAFCFSSTPSVFHQRLLLFHPAYCF
jgi:hypothetical protein